MNKSFKQMNENELKSLISDLEKEYVDIKAKKLELNMARGKPNFDQLDLSMDMLNVINSQSQLVKNMDYRNYGILDGIDEAKEIFAELLDVTTDEITVFGNSSLNIMFDQISRGYTHGYLGEKPWCQEDEVKFLCPVPGYDRHFAITEHFGIKMIPVPLLEDGPDMDMVEEYVNNDKSVKGIWCVPQYSNPSGVTYSLDVVKRFASLKPAAKDFRIFWDNAYCLHHLYNDKQDHVANIIQLCKENDNADIVFEFCSTSKVTFPGSGVAALACSIDNKKDVLKHMTVQSIGHDKINQLRHVEYFKNAEGVKKHMEKQADVLRPKFEMVEKILSEQLSGLDIGTWSHPLGGYFISFNALNGCAKDIVEACKQAGAVLTNAGATYPYGNDPEDSNIRIAPSYPSVDELKQAALLFALCVKLVSAKKILKEKSC
jgi:Transcriptional regulators containing a DNA-binding HTH domain and an aminotransferase domain (MocR family) and their eukaryotic orthologs